jgi:hypothetical protein
VRTEKLRAVESNAKVPAKLATTRLHPKTGQREVLGLVGPRYQVVQNEQACELLDMIAGETGAHFEKERQWGAGRLGMPVQDLRGGESGVVRLRWRDSGFGR